MGSKTIKTALVVGAIAVGFAAIPAIGPSAFATKVGTARVRQVDFQQTDADTANTTNFHSTYGLNLYDVRVDKTITGEVTLEKISPTSLKIHEGFNEKHLPQG